MSRFHIAGDPRLVHVGINAITAQVNTITETLLAAIRNRNSTGGFHAAAGEIQKSLGFVPKPSAKK